MLRMPTRKGYCIDYPKGKTKSGRVLKATYESTSFEAVKKKKEELEKQGIEVSQIFECIF